MHPLEEGVAVPDFTENDRATSAVCSCSSAPRRHLQRYGSDRHVIVVRAPARVAPPKVPLLSLLRCRRRMPIGRNGSDHPLEFTSDRVRTPFACNGRLLRLPTFAQPLPEVCAARGPTLQLPPVDTTCNTLLILFPAESFSWRRMPGVADRQRSVSPRIHLAHLSPFQILLDSRAPKPAWPTVSGNSLKLHSVARHCRGGGAVVLTAARAPARVLHRPTPAGRLLCTSGEYLSRNRHAAAPAPSALYLVNFRGPVQTAR